MRITSVLLVLLAGGCVEPDADTIGPIVRRVHVKDRVLLVEKCTLARDRQALKVTACFIEKLPLGPATICPAPVSTPAQAESDPAPLQSP